MRFNVLKFLEEAEVAEAFYPGKRFVHRMKQTGEYKSHCIVFDWRNPDKIRIEIKAGLSGKDLEPAQLKYYPVCFQSPTFVNVEVVNDNNASDEDEEGEAASGGSGGSGGIKQKKGLLSQVSNAFGEAIEGKIPELGKITEMVILGKEIAKEAYGQVMSEFAHQMSHMKIATTDLLAKASDLVTRYMPPSFIEPKGDEQATYKYDRDKNFDIGLKNSLG